MSTTQTHPEWTKENSLTSPADKDQTKNWRPEQHADKLTETEITEALNELNITSFTEKFPRYDKTYSDPPLPLQMYGLISFVPSKGATPDKNGVYGMAKLRGNFQTEVESNERAEFLIRNYDSYHKIYHTYVGRPFPCTVNSDYSSKTEEIDIRKQIAKDVSQNIKNQKEEERKTMAEIKSREENLLEESKNEEMDPYDNYITLRVKKAQLSWTYLEHQKKLAEVKEIIIKTRKEVEKYNKSNPEYSEKYYEKYMKARRDAGISETTKDSLDNFMKFMVEDAVLPGIDD